MLVLGLSHFSPGTHSDCPSILVFLSDGSRRAPFWRLWPVVGRLYRFQLARWRPPEELVPLREVVTVIDKCGQATKGAWWMSWHQEAMKDVVACDKLREAGKRALIRRFPNEETRVGLLPLTCR